MKDLIYQIFKLFIDQSHLIFIISLLVVISELWGLKYGMYIGIGYIMVYLEFIYKKL